MCKKGRDVKRKQGIHCMIILQNHTQHSSEKTV